VRGRVDEAMTGQSGPCTGDFEITFTTGLAAQNDESVEIDELHSVDEFPCQ
jgi:hypothetical protein